VPLPIVSVIPSIEIPVWSIWIFESPTFRTILASDFTVIVESAVMSIVPLDDPPVALSIMSVILPPMLLNKPLTTPPRGPAICCCIFCMSNIVLIMSLFLSDPLLLCVLPLPEFRVILFSASSSIVPGPDPPSRPPADESPPPPPSPADESPPPPAPFDWPVVSNVPGTPSFRFIALLVCTSLGPLPAPSLPPRCPSLSPSDPQPPDPSLPSHASPSPPSPPPP